MAVVELDATVMLSAADLVRDHALRGADGIHLASAYVLADRTREDVEFISWDGKLRTAASAIGLSVAPTS